MTTVGRPVPMLVQPQAQSNAVRPMFRTLEIASGGLSAQRARLDVSAQNIANAETTRTPEGGPYRRKMVALESAATQKFLPLADPIGQPQPGNSAALGLPSTTPAAEGSANDDMSGVRVAGVFEDTTLGPLVYDPGHPDADSSGYVRMPNVRISDEMLEMMDARRVYDANATVFQAAKAMLHRALDI